jgi:hypothetical protein
MSRGLAEFLIQSLGIVAVTLTGIGVLFAAYLWDWQT